MSRRFNNLPRHSTDAQLLPIGKKVVNFARRKTFVVGRIMALLFDKRRISARCKRGSIGTFAQFSSRSAMIPMVMRKNNPIKRAPANHIHQRIATTAGVNQNGVRTVVYEVHIVVVFAYHAKRDIHTRMRNVKQLHSITSFEQRERARERVQGRVARERVRVVWRGGATTSGFANAQPRERLRLTLRLHLLLRAMVLLRSHCLASFHAARFKHAFHIK